MHKALTVCLAVLILITAASCAGIGVIASQAALYAVRVAHQLRTTEGPAADRDALCEYYKTHHDEVEVVRAYAKAHWSDVPEDYKPALLAINEQLMTCEEPAAKWHKGDAIEHTVDSEVKQPAKKTTARALLAALRRAVALYQKLRAAGIV
jgi:hypothetical protein